MPAGKNYNIQTKNVRTIGTGSAVTVGSSVAAGMKRYVTYIRINQGAGAKNVGTKVWFCSTSTATKASTTAIANAAAKLVLLIPSAVGMNKVINIPEYPDTTNPLFTIAASNYLTVRNSRAQLGSASCAVFVQYYDQ